MTSDTAMSLQQTLELVQVHHVFWENALRRAPRRERKACEFFRRQVQDEIVALSREIDALGPYRDSALPRRVAEEPSLSTARPATKMMRGLPRSATARPF